MYVLFAASPPLLSLHPTLPGAILFTPTLPIIVAIILVALLLLGMGLRGNVYLNQRRGEVSGMATRLGLHPCPDDSLPRGLSLEGTHFHQPHKLTNIYQGIINHSEVVILDIDKTGPKSRWSRTIIAVKTRNPVSVPASLESRVTGSWKLIYAPVGFSNSVDLMEVVQIENLLKNIIH